MNLHRNVTPIRSDIYAAARRIAFSADGDWAKQLGAAETLSQSPDWTDTAIARRIREAYALHRRQQVEDLVKRETEETSVKIAFRYRSEMRAIALGVAAAVVVSVGFQWWVL